MRIIKRLDVIRTRGIVKVKRRIMASRDRRVIRKCFRWVVRVKRITNIVMGRKVKWAWDNISQERS